jgi:hypothetical protein
VSTLNFPALHNRSGLAAGAILELGMLVVLAGIPPRTAPWQFIGAYTLAFCGYAAGLRTLSRDAASIPLSAVLIPALLFRIAALCIDPGLSDDIYRYLWEGKVGLAHLSPYLLPPASPALDPLSDAIRSRVNHPEISSIYPPLAQWLFQAIDAISYSPLAFKIAVTLFDGVTLASIIALLRRRGLPDALVLLYAWNPLPILEFSANGHLDGIAIALLMAALAIDDGARDRPLVVSLLIAGSALVKILSVALLPIHLAWTLRRHGLRTTLAATAVALLALSLAYLPFLSDGAALLEGTSQYGHRWSFNASLFGPARAALGEQPARALMIGAFGTLAGLCLLRRVPLARAGWLLTGGFFLLSPTAHPWYLCWALPFLPLVRCPAWILLSGTVALAYSVFAGAGGWEELPWVPWLEYTPFFLLLAWEAWRGRQGRCGDLHRAWGQGCG